MPRGRFELENALGLALARRFEPQSCCELAGAGFRALKRLKWVSEPGFPWVLDHFGLWGHPKEWQNSRFFSLRSVKGAWVQELHSFRSAFGLAPQDPALPLPRQGDVVSDCSTLDEGEEPPRRLIFAVSLFNTRTRRKYPAPGGAGADGLGRGGRRIAT